MRNRPASPLYRSGIAEEDLSDESRLIEVLYGTLEVKGQCIVEGRYLDNIYRKKEEESMVFFSFSNWQLFYDVERESSSCRASVDRHFSRSAM